MNRLEQIMARLTEIRSLLAGNGEVDIAALQSEVDDLNAEKTSIEARQALLNGITAAATPVPKPNAAPPNGDESRHAVDKFNSIEYRNAFMNFCKTGAAIPTEYRADAFTSTSDASAVVPTTIVDEIIRKMKTYGQIFNRVRKLNIKGGVTIPILSLSPTATWITEAAPSDRQKVQANTSITFSYYGLECKVAESLLSETVSLASFESTIISLIVEAMTRALDLAIINGSGSGQPLGITKDTRVPAGQTVTLDQAEFLQWTSWKKKVFGAIPLSYRAGGSFIMAAGTFEGYIDGMVDDNGQPVGRVNYGITDGPQERFGGREVILVEDDVVKPYDTAAVGDVVGIYTKLTDYGINSNMQMQMYRWLDHDKNQWVDKAILIADGKLIDPNGVIIIKKGAAVPAG